MTLTDQPTASMDPARPTPAQGATGEPCRACGTPLSADQRYCLNCGSRHGAPRLPFAAMAAPAAAAAATPVVTETTTVAAPVPAEDRGSLILLAGVMALLLALAVGVVIGNALSDDGSDQPQVVSLQQGPTEAGGPTASPAAFTPDWPGGTEGWTVQLRALPNSSAVTAVQSAKAEATAKGAAAVGALRSDDYPTLAAGSYIVYSGQYTSQGDADAALPGLKASFPEATVVRVAGSTAPPATGRPSTTRSDPPAATPSKGTVNQQQLEQKKQLSPEEFQKESKKLPDEVQSEGTPPPKDSKPAGGGSGASEEIG